NRYPVRTHGGGRRRQAERFIHRGSCSGVKPLAPPGPCQAVHVIPQPPPLRALGRGQAVQGRAAADSGQVGVKPPAAQFLPDPISALRGRLSQLPLPKGEFGAQPGPGLLPPTGALPAVYVNRVLALTGAGQDGHSGGDVTVSGFTVLYQFVLKIEG